LTGPAAGGHLLAVPPGGAPVAVDAFCGVPGAGATDAADPLDALVAVEVDFGDARQTFHAGPAAVAAFGLLDGLARLHARWGRLPLADLAAPAAALAREGVPLNAQQGYVATLLAPILALTPESRARWLPNGRLLGEGDVFRDPELGDTIERLGREGAAALRTGDLAAACVARVAGDGVALTAADLA
ncbi:gamma-glutamyltransferase, partial [Patulibacter sp. S7RM1-6]